MKRRLLPLLLCLALLLLSACGGTATGSETAPSAGDPSGPPAAPGTQPSAAEPLQEPTDSLTVYIGDVLSYQYLDRMERIFAQSHPDVTLEITTISFTDTTAATKLAAELAAGRGPDLYIGIGDEFKDFYKALNTGAFCDLTPYLENMERFDRSNYVENIFDAGMYRGKLYFVPLTWSYPGVITTQEALDKAGIAPESLGTFSGFMQAARNFSDANDGVSAFYERGIGPYFLQNMDISYLNYETSEVSVDTAEFREMIDAYKLIYAQDWTGLESEGTVSYGGETAFSLRNGNHIFTNSSYNLGLSIDLDINQDFCCFTGRETALLLPLPTMDGIIDARLNLIAAINANSKNKANAADLIELLLQENLQKEISVFSIPVHITAIQGKVAEAQTLPAGGTKHIGSGGEVIAESKNITQEEAEYLVEKLSHVDQAHVLLYSVLELIFNDMEPYFKDEQTYEACLQRLQLDLTIYISE